MHQVVESPDPDVAPLRHGLTLGCSLELKLASDVSRIFDTPRVCIVQITQNRLFWLWKRIKMLVDRECRPNARVDQAWAAANHIDPGSQGMNRVGVSNALAIAVAVSAWFAGSACSIATAEQVPASQPAEQQPVIGSKGHSDDATSDVGNSGSDLVLTSRTEAPDTTPTETKPVMAVRSASPTAAGLPVDPQVVAARQRVQNAARRLENFLNSGPMENAQQWKNYLHWETLQSQIQPGVKADAAVLAKPLTNFYSGERGLELPQFVDLRDALMGFRRIVLYKSDEPSREAFDKQMAANARDMFDPERNRDYGKMAARLAMMEQLYFAPDVVRSARQQYSQPNLYVIASANMVSRALSEAVNRSEPLRENILGTLICGTANLRGQLTADLVPSSDQALIELCLTGVSTANTVGRRSPVTIYSRGFTRVSARKTLCLDALGIGSLPARARCTTSSRIDAIRADDRLGKRLIEKIAWNKARQQQRQVEQVSSRRAEQRIAQRLNEQTAARLAQTNDRLLHKVRRPLESRNLYPRWLNFSTAQGCLKLTALQAGIRQLAATNNPPPRPAHDFVVQVHETTFLNTAVNFIGGMNLTDERAVELIEEATGDVPPELALKQDEDPWSITFDLDQPVHVSFADDQIKIAVRGRRFTRGEQVVRQTADIAATYDLHVHDGRAKLVRDGDVEVTYPGKTGRLSLTELRNKTFLTSKFGALFKEQLGGDELKLPGDMEGLAAIQDLRLNYALARDGWLTLGWN